MFYFVPWRLSADNDNNGRVIHNKIDVKERLNTYQAAFEQMRQGVSDATDFDSLKANILSALANVDTMSAFNSPAPFDSTDSRESDYWQYVSMASLSFLSGYIIDKLLEAQLI